METLDPRYRNENFDAGSIWSYFDGYAARLATALAEIDREALARASVMVADAAAAGRRIFTIGNGGSAAIADHLCCDWTKGTHVAGHPVIDGTSVTAKGGLYSALADEFGFEIAFSRQKPKGLSVAEGVRDWRTSFAGSRVRITAGHGFASVL